MPQKILYLVSEDWYFVSHRLPMARAARDAGFEVHVATRVARQGDAIKAEGFVLHPISWQRGSLNPFHLLPVLFEIRGLYKQVQPDIVHHIAVVPAVVGSLAAVGLPVTRVSSLTGLGFAFTSRTPKSLAIRSVLEPLLRWLLGRGASAVVVQNPDDQELVEGLGISSYRITRIAGSGVDVNFFTPLPEPAGPITVGYVGRLLDDKGVGTLVEAFEELRQSQPINLILAGDPDPANPASIPESVLADWKQKSGVTLGHVKDVREVWRVAHIAVLASRREGLPLSLLEAAACARPIVATDVPGCREIARQHVNALLVPRDDPHALADAIARLARDAELRARFGKAGRQLAEREFSSDKIGREVVSLYKELIERLQTHGSLYPKALQN